MRQCGVSAFRIRPTRPADAEGVVRVRIAAWQAAYRGLMPDAYLDAMGHDLVQAAERLRQWLAAPHLSSMLVGEDLDGTIVAMCSYGPPRDDDAPSGSGSLHAINLHPAAWGTGLGAQLLQHAERGLAVDGYGTAYLWVVDGNARARRFYERAGWRVEGATKIDDQFETGVTEVRYRRVLADRAMD